MSLPEPQVGLVISYGYLWADQAKIGREEGKIRPCMISAVEKWSDKKRITVQPITTKGGSIPPSFKVEVPPKTKIRLGLDDRQSWIVTNENNGFMWPGYDLGQFIRNSVKHYSYGFMPEKIINDVLVKIRRNSISVCRDASFESGSRCENLPRFGRKP